MFPKVDSVGKINLNNQLLVIGSKATVRSTLQNLYVPEKLEQANKGFKPVRLTSKYRIYSMNNRARTMLYSLSENRIGCPPIYEKLLRAWWLKRNIKICAIKVINVHFWS